MAIKTLTRLFAGSVTIIMLFVVLALFNGWGRLFQAMFKVIVPLTFLSGFCLMIFSLWVTAIRRGVSLGFALFVACILAFLSYLAFLLFTTDSDWHHIISGMKEMLDGFDVFKEVKMLSNSLGTTYKHVFAFFLLLTNGAYLAKRRRPSPLEWLGVNMIVFALFWLWLNWRCS
jgi:hypothetical protein